MFQCLIKQTLVGYINREEFHEACELIKEYLPNSNSMEQLDDICQLMDLNKDGLVDLNEFLESFRMVDKDRTRNEDSTEEKENLPEVTVTDSAKSTEEKENKEPPQSGENTKKETPDSGSPSSLPLFTVSPLSSASLDVVLAKDNPPVKSNKLNDSSRQKKEHVSFTPSDSIQSLSYIELVEKSDTIHKSNSSKELTDANAESEDIPEMKANMQSPVLSTRRGSQI